jgi:glucan phosphoethanolaminetransferase (alkaline phosphatase superfamily)
MPFLNLKIFKKLQTKEYIGLVLILCLFALPDFFKQRFIVNHSWFTTFGVSFGLTGLIFCLPLVFFAKYLRLYLYLLIPLVFCIPIIVAPYFFLRTYFNKDVIYLITGTNPLDSSEFGLSTILLLLGVLIGYIFLYIFLVRMTPKSINTKFAFLLSTISLCIFLFSPFILRKITTITYSTRQLVSFNAFVDFYDQCTSYYSDIKDQRKYYQKIKEFKFGVKTNKKASNTKRKVHILVLGESSRAQNWSLYGYERNTNPLLSNRNDVYVYKNVISGGTYTARSIPLIITRATPETYSRHINEPCLAKAFEESGYNTYYINMNPKFELMGVANTIHHLDFKNVIWNEDKRITKDKHPLDGEMLEYLSEILEKDKGDIFIMMYMLGSHMKYYHRYNANFTRFKPDNYGEIVSESIQKEMINAYDNSIVYTDYFLNTLIEKLKIEDIESSVLYISDHGENLFDNEDKTFGHGTVSEQVLRVPLVVWTSGKHKIEYPLINKNLRSNENRNISSAENIFYSYLDIANITLKETQPTLSFANNFFLDNPQKFAGEGAVIQTYKSYHSKKPIK